MAHLKKQGYISDQGQTLPTLQKAVEQNKLELPKETAAAGVEIAKVIASASFSAAPVTASALAGMTYTRKVEAEKTVSYDDAKELLGHFEKKGYISKAGAIKDTMKNALLTGTLDLPAKFEAARARFEQIIAKADKRPAIRDASRDVTVRLNKQAILSPEFMELGQDQAENHIPRGRGH